MNIGLDTTVVVRLLMGLPYEQAASVRDRLTLQPDASVAVSDLVVSETYFVLRHHYDVPHGRAISSLAILLSDPRILSSGIARLLLSQLPHRESGAGFMDRLIHASYEADGLPMLTFDRAAARLPAAELIA